MSKMEKQNTSSLNIPIAPLSWSAFKQSPFVSNRLRKLKSRAMVEAMARGIYEKGNHRITYEALDDELASFTFHYRGTVIAQWSIIENTSRLAFVHAGPYEGTLSTEQQRREVQRAVLLFKEVYDL